MFDFDKEKFIDSVLLNFDFVVKDYGFTYIGFSPILRNRILFFTKKDFILELIYNFSSNDFTVELYKKTNVNTPYSWEKISLMWLVISKEGKDTGNKIYDKCFDTLEKNIQYKASLLKMYGEKMLSGKEWNSWKDVSGFQKETLQMHVRLEVGGEVIKDYIISEDINKSENNNKKSENSC